MMRISGEVVARRGRSAFLWLALAIATTMLLLSCSSASPSAETPFPTATPSLSYVLTDPGPGRTGLRCEECPLVEVTGVVDADTIQTDEGPVRIYGVFVAPEEELCVAEVNALFTQLIGGTVRVERGTQETDSRGVTLRYLYTADGDSIDELLVRSGTTRVSAFQGQHAPWLVFQASEARMDGAGCVWQQFRDTFSGRGVETDRF